MPNEDFGEEVKAVVQLLNPAQASPALAAELIAHCRQHLAAFRCPRSVDFDPDLPRHPTGKLCEQLVRRRYWPGCDADAGLASRFGGVDPDRFDTARGAGP